MRTENSARNLITALLGQGLGLLVSLFSRIVFIHFLGKEYLGVNGLFTELLTMLSLVELGIGPAIIYSLYKPLAEKDYKKVHALMKIFQKAYIIIGFLVMFLGILTTPFLHYIIKDIPDVPNIRIVFLLFTLNSSISYFFSYKRSLLIADQHRYIATIYRYGFYIFLNLFQMLFLYFTQNYLLYLILQIIFTLLENIAVSLHSDYIYPFLRNRSSTRIDKATASQIIRNTKALVINKIGGMIVFSTDSILISVMVGTVFVGLYSNYQLIIRALKLVIDQVFNSLTASIGNLHVTDTVRKSMQIFNALFFLNFWIFGFCSISLYNLANPFIIIWLGEDLLLPANITLIITINFYIDGMRKATLTFREAFGLYWYDRYKHIFTAIINLSASVVLVRKFGMAGIFYGTLVSMLSTCFWVEPYVLYKYGFNKKSRIYFFKYILYTSVVVATGFLTKICCGLIMYTGIAGLLSKVIICCVIPNLIFLLLFYKTREFQFLRDKTVYVFAKMKSKFTENGN